MNHNGLSDKISEQEGRNHGLTSWLTSNFESVVNGITLMAAGNSCTEAGSVNLGTRKETARDLEIG